jgi:O-acetyl-ADP-ribose deacetylase (regulator of RNase III)
MTTIKEVEGSILTLKNGIIVHGCNSKGKMNSGIAKSIRLMYPGAHRVYEQEFHKNGLFLGKVIYYRHPASADGSRIVIANAITQEKYGRDKNIVYVDYPTISTCFEDIARTARIMELPVHFPLIGCGLANGKWPQVSERIEAALGPDIDKTLWIYE